MNEDVILEVGLLAAAALADAMQILDKLPSKDTPKFLTHKIRSEIKVVLSHQVLGIVRCTAKDHQNNIHTHKHMVSA